jgi:spermidine synthase
LDIKNLQSRNREAAFATFFLALSMLATGASGLVTEYILSTVSTYILGSSIEQFSIIIALMLLMMGVASWFQKFFSDENLIEKFIIIEVLLALLGGFAPILLYMAFGFFEYHFQLVQYFFVLSLGFLIGFEIPLILRINQRYAKTLQANLAVVSAADYIGSFLGAIIWVKFLLRRFPLTEIGFILAMVNFGVAVLTCFYFMRKGLLKHKVLPVIVFIVVSIVLGWGYRNNRNWNMGAEQKLYSDKIIFSHTTKYQHLVMTENKNLDEKRFYINGNLQFSSLDEARYHEQLVHPIMSMDRNHKHVLILGGGDGLALREVLKYDDVEIVKLVDLDPDMVDFCSTNEEMISMNKNSFANAKVFTETMLNQEFESEKGTVFVDTDQQKNNRPVSEKVADVNIIHVDAFNFVRKDSMKWDVIIIDLPDPNSVELAKLYSRGFYSSIRNVLTEDGFMVIQSTSPYHAKEAFLCIGRSLEGAKYSVLPFHDNIPSFGDWGWWIACKNENILKNAIQRMKNRKQFDVKTNYLTPNLFVASLEFGKDGLKSKFDDVSTLMHPVILDRYLYESWKVE